MAVVAPRVGRILVVDNHPRRLESTQSLLKQKGYYTLTAGSLAEADRLLAGERVHLALLDVRMEFDQDILDTSGIHFAGQIDPVVAIIITTAFPTTARAAEAILELMGNRKSPPDFANTRDGPDKLLDKIKQAFAEKIQLNFALKIRWGDNLNVGQIVQKIGLKNYPPEVVADEVEQVLGKLFFSAAEVIVSPLESNRGSFISSQSDAAVLIAKPNYQRGGWGAPVILKLAARQQILTEAVNYEHFVRDFIHGNRRTNLERSAETHLLGGILYSLVGTASDEITDLGSFYGRHEAVRIMAVLTTLFESTCRLWYNNRQPRREVDFLELYGEFLTLSLPKIETALAEEGLAKFISPATLQFPGLDLVLPNPAHWLKKQSGMLLPVHTCFTHGDLHSGNILLDDREQAWLIDFQRTGPGHWLRDLIELETDVKFNLLEVTNLPELYKFELALLVPNHLGQTPAPPDFAGYPALAKAFAVVSGLRQIARHLLAADVDMQEYYWGLLFLTLNIIHLKSIDRLKKQHALLAAALLAQRLEGWPER